MGCDETAADPLAWPGIRGERVLYQPSGHGREREVAVPLIAQRTIHDHLLHIGGLYALIVDQPLLSAAASGRRKYTDYLERQRAGKAKSAKEVKRKALSDENTSLEKRQKVGLSVLLYHNKFGSRTVIYLLCQIGHRIKYVRVLISMFV